MLFYDAKREYRSLAMKKRRAHFVETRSVEICRRFVSAREFPRKRLSCWEKVEKALPTTCPRAKYSCKWIIDWCSSESFYCLNQDWKTAIEYELFHNSTILTLAIVRGLDATCGVFGATCRCFTTCTCCFRFEKTPNLVSTYDTSRSGGWEIKRTRFHSSLCYVPALKRDLLRAPLRGKRKKKLNSVLLSFIYRDRFAFDQRIERLLLIFLPMRDIIKSSI